MTTPHSEEHEELLAELAAGERSPDDPAVAARLAACPQCRAELDELLDAARLLDEVERAERDALARAAELPDSPGEPRIAPVVRELARAHARRRALRLVAGAALAAAALALALLVPRDRAPRRGDVMLGSGAELRCIAPVGAVERYDPFRWDGELEEGQAFRVRVWAEGEDALLDAPALELDETQQRTWSPPADRVAALGGAIGWTVEVVDGEGQQVRSVAADASLR